MELGIYSFGELAPDPHTGRTASAHERLGDLVTLARVADEGGLDVIALGEHHRKDFTISAPEIVLANIAAVTSRIRLSSAVTVLSTQDPVRVFQQFATLDQLSSGRAEIIAGRGAFIESYPLFGYNLQDYDGLFEEKIRLLRELRDHEVVNWDGNFRPSLRDADIIPQAYQSRLPIWIGAGGTPASFVRAGSLGMPVYMGFFTGPEHFTPLVELYHRAAQAAGHDPSTLRTGSGGHMFLHRSSQAAREEYFPYYSSYFSSMPQFAGGMPRHVFDSWLENGLIVGSPQEVVDKIMRHRELLDIDRFIGQIDVGNLPFRMAADSLELFATEVAPVLRAETAGRQGAAA
jgi:probable LLM family oxidoreductase